MLNKIAFKALRQKWRDYSVLVLGTMIAVAIFYLFTTIATNEPLLKSISTQTRTVIIAVFIFGEVLLGIITFVYLNFANSFLLRLRQKDYGLLSMLGASKRQIGGLLMRETLLIGIVATCLGLLVGTGLTAMSGHYLMSLLGVKLSHWSVLTPKAISVTVIFFLIVFLLNGLYNRMRLMHWETLHLLQATQSVKHKAQNRKKQIALGLLGLMILAISYALMPKVPHLRMTGLVVVLILNVVGTYLFVGQTLTLITDWIRKSDFGQHGLRQFLNGQLSFRLDEYKRIFTMIAVLFGLALGAISVGQGYYMSLPKQAVENNALTLVLQNEQTKTNQLKGITYHAEIPYVVNQNQVYFDKQALQTAKVPTLELDAGAGMNKPRKHTTLNVNPSKVNENFTLMEWASYIQGVPFGGHVKLVNQLPKGHHKKLALVKVKDMPANQQRLQKMWQQEAPYTKHGELMVPGAYGNFVTLKSIFGGLEFMSIFLGVAFLVMLASILMFKTLSNVVADRRRYGILKMIGTTPSQARWTSFKDLGILFFIPMLIGILDSGFGLQMFKPLMVDPYVGLPTALVLVLSIYALYFGVTLFSYQRLVLKK